MLHKKSLLNRFFALAVGLILFGFGSALLVNGAKAAEPGKLRWAKGFVGAEKLHGARLALFAEGGFAVAGNYEGRPDFGAGPLPAPSHEGFFLARFTADGALLWARDFTAVGQLHSSRLLFDREGGLVLVGNYFGAPDFGSGPLPQVLEEEHGLYLARFNQDGDLLWVKGFLTELGQGAQLALTTEGGILISGTYRGAFDLGAGPLPHSATADYGTFLAAFEADGKLSWAQGFIPMETSDYIASKHLALDPAGSIVLIGDYSGAPDLGLGSLPSAQEAPGFFLARVGPDGTLLTSQGLGAGFHSISDLALGLGGEVILTGPYYDSLDLGAGPIREATGEGLFLARFTEAGSLRWVRLGQEFFSLPHLARDQEDGSVVGGIYQGHLHLGETPLSEDWEEGLFLARYDREGSLDWAKAFSGLQSGTFFGLSLDKQGQIIVVGSYGGSFDLGHGALPAAGDGGKGLFIASVAP